MSRRRSKPYHLRFHGDALGGYELLSLEERGAYTTLLDQMYDHGGPLRDEPRNACAWLNCDVRVWKRLRAALVDQHKKLQSYTDDRGVAWLVNDRVQRELKQPTYAELTANLSPKLPIATPELTAKSQESVKENNGGCETENPIFTPLIPSPIPITPIAPKGAATDQPISVRKADVEAVWSATPKRSRERSGKADVERALGAAAKRGHPPDAVLAGLIGYFASAGATKDGGEFVKGVHRMIEADRWQAFVEERELPLLTAAARDDGPWPRRVRAFAMNAYWEREWGAKPGQPGCQVPPEIQREHGIEPAPPTAIEGAAA